MYRYSLSNPSNRAVKVYVVAHLRYVDGPDVGFYVEKV